VTIDIADDLDPIMADANQLEAAMLNIVVNARDAMSNGGALFITARNAEIASGNDHDLAAGRYVCLSISDTGAGMNEEILSRAKEPFFTTKGVGKGTGLGLSQVHGLLEQLSGRLVLKSAPDSGTTAELWLPVAVRPVVQMPASEHEQASATPQGLRILAVDDDALVLMNTAAMLEDMGHKVREANSAQEAIDILNQEPPFDIIITDMAMPQMNGLDLARAVWKDWPDVPMLLATGYAELPEKPERRLHILSKPFGQRELAKGLEMALNEPLV
jgi:CheY-like chemotaxis protein